MHDGADDGENDDGDETAMAFWAPSHNNAGHWQQVGLQPNDTPLQDEDNDVHSWTLTAVADCLVTGSSSGVGAATSSAHNADPMSEKQAPELVNDRRPSQDENPPVGPILRPASSWDDEWPPLPSANMWPPARDRETSNWGAYSLAAQDAAAHNDSDGSISSSRATRGSPNRDRNNTTADHGGWGDPSPSPQNAATPDNEDHEGPISSSRATRGGETTRDRNSRWGDGRDLGGLPSSLQHSAARIVARGGWSSYPHVARGSGNRNRGIAYGGRRGWSNLPPIPQNSTNREGVRIPPFSGPAISGIQRVDSNNRDDNYYGWPIPAYIHARPRSRPLQPIPRTASARSTLMFRNRIPFTTHNWASFTSVEDLEPSAVADHVGDVDGAADRHQEIGVSSAVADNASDIIAAADTEVEHRYSSLFGYSQYPLSRQNYATDGHQHLAFNDHAPDGPQHLPFNRHAPGGPRQQFRCLTYGEDSGRLETVLPSVIGDSFDDAAEGPVENAVEDAAEDAAEDAVEDAVDDAAPNVNTPDELGGWRERFGWGGF